MDNRLCNDSHFYGSLGDAGVEVICQALMEGEFDSLVELGLDCNGITSRGLASVARLAPTVLPRLEKLSLIGHEKKTKNALPPNMSLSPLLYLRPAFSDLDSESAGTAPAVLVLVCSVHRNQVSTPVWFRMQSPSTLICRRRSPIIIDTAS
jgi:hypothetical protein